LVGFNGVGIVAAIAVVFVAFVAFVVTQEKSIIYSLN
jgi:hypothetical protein